TTKTQTICTGDSILLTTSSNGIKTFSWSPAASIRNKNAASTYAFPLGNPATFKLTATTSSGCILNDSVKISLFPSKPPKPVIQYVTDGYPVYKNANAVSQLVVKETVSRNIASLTEYISVDGGAYSKAATVPYTGASSDTFTNTGLANDKHTYKYIVIATDSCGSNSDTASYHSPVYLRGNAGNMKNYLHFSRYIGGIPVLVSLLRAEVKPVQGVWRALNNVNNSDTSYADSADIQCGYAYAYGSITYLPNGTTTSYYNLYADSIVLSPFDTIPQVNILRASVTNGNNIALRFSKLPESAVYKYLVYVKKDHGAFALLDSVLAKNITGSTYTYNYKTNALSDTFSFKVFALDSCGNESKTTEMHRAMQLNGKALEDSSSLSWSNYLGFGVKNYVVQTWSKAKGWTDYKTLPANDSVFKEPEHCNAILNFRIKAKSSSADSAIAYSDSIQIQPFDSVPPPRDSMVSVSVVNGTHITVTFNKSKDTDVIGYVVYRSKNHGAFADIDKIKRPASGPVVFTDNINAL